MFETQKGAKEASGQLGGGRGGWGKKLLEVKQANHAGQCEGALALKSGPACGEGLAGHGSLPVAS